jgi:tRNA(Ile)-lysidine synthase TilS/MesJ
MIDAKALQKLMAFTRRAIEKYDMIEEGDRIAVGVSGGKDSLALLCALQGLSRFYPKKFEVVPINLYMGFPNEDNSVSKALCEQLGLTLNVVGTGEIYPVVFEVRKEKHPCSLCSNMRRGGLHNAAKELGCNKLALGHHFDDAVETIIMNLFIEGRFDCFRPVTYLDRSDMTVIRPLLYAPEKEISHFIRACGIEPVPKNCPADGNTRREEAKKALAELEHKDRGVKLRIFNAYFEKHAE